MKLRSMRAIAVLLLHCLFLCSCSEPTETVRYGTNETYDTLESFHAAMSEMQLPDNFIWYEDIAFIGSFVSGAFLNTRNTGTQRYRIKDAAGNYLEVNISERKTKAAAEAALGQTYGGEALYRMPAQNSFCYAPENGPAQRGNRAQDKNSKIIMPIDGYDKYIFKDILYIYYGIDHMQRDGSGKPGELHAVEWTYGKYTVNLCFAHENPDLTLYSDAYMDSFIGRLVDSDSAQGAVQQLNQAIFWRRSRVALKKNVPLLICLLCVLSVGTAVLVTGRKRKNSRKETDSMIKFNHIATIRGGQDGAIWGNFLFRFGSEGECAVYDLRNLSRENARPVAAFVLDKASKLVPHSNTVFFGTEYAQPGDEFPLLYSNIYNNYSKYSDRLEGICCVYRLWREGGSFHTSLMQLIEIGFADDRFLWLSGSAEDVRPYGNFIIDRERSLYYAFTMRDETSSTRYFAFPLPRLDEGTPDPQYGVRRVVLTKRDILRWFDCPYHHYVQGACCHDGRIYSLEGFTDDEENLPALRIIDTDRECQETLVRMGDHGLTIEPELIDFAGDTCWYCDNEGNLYILEL